MLSWILTALVATAAIVIFPSDYLFGIRPIEHRWEQYHLFISAKYFPELQYQHFYACALKADKENEPTRWTEPRIVRNLNTNELVDHREIPADACGDRFSTERWQEFRSDISYFAKVNDELRPGRYLDTFRDFGVNVTPFWAAVYSALIRHVPASDISTAILSSFDFTLLIASLILIFAGWGFVPTSYVILFLSVNEASRPGWIVGSLFRFEWFFLFVVGAFLIKKNRLTGAFACNVLSNLFRPVTVFATPLLFVQTIRDRKSKSLLLMTMLLLGVALLPGLKSYEDYASNSGKYMNSFLTNRIGLQPLLATPSEDEMVRATEHILVEHPELKALPPQVLNETLYRREMTDARRQASGMLIIASAAVLLLTISLVMLPPLETYLFSSVLSLFLLSPPCYYTLLLGLLFLRPRVSRWVTSISFLMLALGKLLPLFFGQRAVTYSSLSWLLLSICLAHLVDSLIQYRRKSFMIAFPIESIFRA